MKERFTALTDDECFLLFEALFFCIESATGIGFRSHNQSHMDYEDGAAERTPLEDADRAEQNVIFQMIRELSLRLADHPNSFTYRKFGLTTWEQFCAFATKAARSHENDANRYVPLHMRSKWQP